MVQEYKSERRLFGLRLLIVRVVWAGITLLVLTMLVLAIPLEYKARLAEGANLYADTLASLNLSPVFFASFRTFMDLSLALIFFTIAVVVFIRKSSSRIVILSSIATQAFGALFVPTLYFLETAQPVWDVPVSLIRAIGLATSLIVFFYLIPDGKFNPAWTRGAAVVWIGLVAIWFLFPNSPANLVHMTTWSNTLMIGFVVYIIAYGSGIYAQFYRYRAVSDAAQRQQTKWFVLGTTLGFIGFFLYHLPLVLLPNLFGHPGIYRLQHIFWGIPLYHLFILAIPVCIGISINRHRLWDIDHLVNRAIIAGVLTITLAAVYAASVISLSQILLWITGREEDAIVAAISTLGISVLFVPLRRRIQDLIDRRFYRQRYNAELTLAALSISLREEVDLEMLLKGLITLVQNTLHPAQISIWLCEQAETRAGNQKSHGRPSLIQAWIKPDDPIVPFFLANPNILEIRHFNLASPTVTALKQANVSISIPLIGQGQFVGLINLGNRLGGQDYSIDDTYLLTILANQAAPALRVAQLVCQQQQELVERERVEYEMNVARMIQQNFLPKQLPDLADWQVAAFYQPARAVGGDFYDFHHYPDGRMGFIIGDVSGHGIPAALMMVNIRSTLRDAARKYDSPGTILKHANNHICQEMPQSMFATCLYAILDPAGGEIVFANAGHNLPMRWANNQIEELWSAGYPLGIMENVEYEECYATIHPQECLLLFSDGIVEARNSDREMFGEERIKEVIARNTGDARAIIDELLKTMTLHLGEDAEQEDDVTIVSLHHAPSGS
jgi:serine phosphatase RsbU (regulator of sigma subunit)